MARLETRSSTRDHYWVPEIRGPASRGTVHRAPWTGHYQELIETARGRERGQTELVLTVGRPGPPATDITLRQA
jgi:hypothetical protein